MKIASRTGRVVDPHAIEGLRRHPRADLDVAAGADLADVVQERAEQGAIDIVKVLDRFSLHRVVGLGRGQHLAHAGQRGRQMGIDGEPMVRVALRAASDVRPCGDEPHQQPEPVERIERIDAGIA